MRKRRAASSTGLAYGLGHGLAHRAGPRGLAHGLGGDAPDADGARPPDREAGPPPEPGEGRAGAGPSRTHAELHPHRARAELRIGLHAQLGLVEAQFLLLVGDAQADGVILQGVPDDGAGHTA